jgi:beta-lactamase class A
MIKILLDQKFNEIIPAQLPKEVKVAHKTGSVSSVRHDCGIIMLPDGSQYVLVLLSKNLKDEEQGIKAMADVSRIVYDYVIAN